MCSSMSTIASYPDQVADGAVVIGPWKLFGHWMRGEMVRSSVPQVPAAITVWMLNPGVVKVRVCTAEAAHAISGVSFCEPFRCSSLLWRQNVAAKLVEHYCEAIYAHRKELASC